MPICIAGMHRAGTSMVARLLNLCGLYLGDESDLIPANPANAEGFWENRRFVRLNDEILDRLGLGWDLPFTASAGWELRAEMAPLVARAGEVVAQFEHAGFWGWKDPRTSLTLPFWRRLLPGLRVVVCLRHPLEVAMSLRKRGASSLRFGYLLWFDYYRQLLAATTPAERIVTHYDSYFHDAPRELERLLRFVRLDVSDRTAGRACAAVMAPLRHHAAGGAEAKRGALPAEVAELYAGLCAEAGPVLEALLQAAPPAEGTGAEQAGGEVEAEPVSAPAGTVGERSPVAPAARGALRAASVSLIVLNPRRRDTKAWLSDLLAGYPQEQLEIIAPGPWPDGEPAGLPALCWLPVEAGASATAVANRAAEAARGEYLAFVRGGLSPGEGWLWALLGAMQGRPELACAGLPAAGQGGIALAGRVGDAFGLAHSSEAEGGAATTPEGYTLLAVRAPALYRRRAFLEAGGFGDGAAPFEDADLGWRLWLRGYRCALLGGTPASFWGEAPSPYPSCAYTPAATQGQALRAAFTYLEQENLADLLPGLFAALLGQGRWAPAAHGALPAAVTAMTTELSSLIAARVAAQEARTRSDAEIFALTGHPFAALLRSSACQAVREEAAQCGPPAGFPVEEADTRLALAEWLNLAHTHHERCLAAEVVALANSPGWELVRRLREARLWLLPVGSRRERLLCALPRGVGVCRSEGLGAILRKGRRLVATLGE